MKSTFLFLATFLVGAALAFATRTALHSPYTPPSSPPASTPPAPETAVVVNTVCAICGMDVDPDIQPANYQGKLIGFGCSACPPRFAREPDRYGPSALRNEVAKK